MNPEVAQLTRLLHQVLDKLNAKLDGSRVHVFEMPVISGAHVGAALWMPHAEATNIPQYTVMSRENSRVTPQPSSEFEQLLQANRALLHDVGHHADNTLVCTFDRPLGNDIQRTQFHVSQWPSREAAGVWMRGSQAHAQVLDLIRHQPTVDFQPSVLASYERVSGRVAFFCNACQKLVYRGEDDNKTHCHACLK